MQLKRNNGGPTPAPMDNLEYKYANEANALARAGAGYDYSNGTVLENNNRLTQVLDDEGVVSITDLVVQQQIIISTMILGS